MKTFRFFLTGIFLLCCSVMQAEVIDGINYSLNSSSKTASVISRTEYYSGDIVIPESVEFDGIPYSVTSIGNYAFQGCSSLTSVVIGNSVTSIGYQAFYYCSSLTSVVIPNSVTSIGDYAFYNCSGLISLVIPEGVTSIGVNAFSDCSGLTSLVIPEGVTSIRNYAFSNCSGLVELKIPSTVEYFGTAPFYGCSGHLHINCDIPDPSNSSQDGIFYEANFSEVTFGDSVSSIGNRAFYFKNSKYEYHTQLKKVTLGKNLKRIGDYAFYQCKGLTSLVIPEGVDSIGYNAFAYCSGLVELEIPSTVEYFEGHAFAGCTGHLYINCDIPDATYSGNSIFCDNKFSKVTFGDSVSSIGDYAFSNCSRLTSLVIPEGVDSIGSYAFSYCSGLVELKISSTVEYYGTTPFKSCSGHLYINCDIPNATYSSNGIFYENKFSEVTFGDSVSSIGDYAFSYCSGLVELVIPEGVTSIGNYAFSNCSGLTSLVISEGVTSIGNYAFNNCSGLISLVIPEGVTSIGNYAFNNCSGLTSLVIPEGVTSIGNYAFSGIDTVEVQGSVPADIQLNSFGDAIIYVPTKDFPTYSKANIWNEINGLTCKQYDNVTVTTTALTNGSGVLQEISDDYIRAVMSLKVIGSINSYDIIVLRDKTPFLHHLDISEANVVSSTKAFYNGVCTKTDTLGAYAFYNLNKLRSVKLPHNLLTIADYTFYDCKNLEEVEIPSTVKSIGSFAFYNTNIDSIIIPEGIKTIENSTFYSCDKLKYVSFPKGLERIENYAFEDTNIEKIIFPTTLKHIEHHAFEGNSSVSEVRIPSSVQSISDNAFNGCNNLKKVYTYTVEPTQISENTFSASTFETATLYVPSVSYYNYYWDDGWKRFLNLEFFDEPYEYFYLNGDKEVNDDTGFIEGDGENNPDADINAGGGLEVGGEEDETEGPKQPLGDVNVENDGNGNCGSMIGNNNLVVDRLHMKITVKGGKWYFFSFPFDVDLKNVWMEKGSKFVFRYYDGGERAHGKSGWKNFAEGELKAGQGYIFQCSANDVLVLKRVGAQFSKKPVYKELSAHASDNKKDASWNFMGNPYLSYYDMNEMDFTAPVTVWDGSKYVAVRPGDDDYHFTPYEAFFVQKPEGTNDVKFDGEKQMTQTQSKNKKAKQSATRKMMVMNARAQENPRKLVNLTLTAGEATDGTRIVFNNAQSRAYESECDAAKFETQGVIQLFTIGDQQERYAINERPADNGIVMLGFTAPSAGEFSISASRMDTPVYLKDRETGALVDLSKGAYNFTAKAGTNVNRFEVLMEATVTGIKQVGTTEGEDAKVYDLGGRRVKENGKGVYIINGEKTLVK